MKISSPVLGLAAASVCISCISQGSEPKAVRIQVYDGNDLGSYYDPPYWSYRPKGFWHPKSAHWLYKNHRYVLIDIKINDAASR
jgi:hypothetical protein